MANLVWPNNLFPSTYQPTDVTTQENLIVVGDSQAEYGYRGGKNCGGDNFGIRVMYTTGSALTTDQASNGGTLTYTAATNSIAWQCVGDPSPGPAITADVGVFDLESSVANKGIRIGIRALDSLNQDRSITVTYTGTVQFANQSKGVVTQFVAQNGQPFGTVTNLGIGGLRCSEAANPRMLAFYSAKAIATNSSKFLVILGSNDITDNTDASVTIWNNIRKVVDNFLNMGMTGAIIGIPARYQSSALPTTAMLAAQLQKHGEVNASAKAYADSIANGALKFIDAYQTTRDNTVATGIPQTGMIAASDGIHIEPKAAALIGRDCKGAGIKPYVPVKTNVNPKNLIRHAGYMQGAPLTASATGASGVYPAGCSPVQRDLGTDATVVSSIVDRNGTKAWKWVITGTADTQRIVGNFPSWSLPQTISQTGDVISAGDTIYMEADVEFENVNLCLADLFIYTSNGSANRYYSANLVNSCSSAFSVTTTPISTGFMRLRISPFKIPSDVTTMRIFLSSNTGANASGTLYWSNVELFKVP